MARKQNPAAEAVGAQLKKRGSDVDFQKYIKSSVYINETKYAILLDKKAFKKASGTTKNDH